MCLQFYTKLSNSVENVVWTNNEVKKEAGMDILLHKAITMMLTYEEGNGGFSFVLRTMFVRTKYHHNTTVKRMTPKQQCRFP
ncbi:hypothetical protein YC2023_037154 [Brassica napus]